MVNWQRGVMRAMGIANVEVVVTGVEDFTERYRRVHFSGAELLSRLEALGPTMWTRLWFPHPEKGAGHLSQRAYTFVDADLERGTFALDFVLHDEPGSAESGPGSRWAAEVEPGARIEGALTPNRIALPADAEHVVLAGDLSALPAVNSWLGTIPAEVRVSVVLEDGVDAGGAVDAEVAEDARGFETAGGAVGAGAAEGAEGADSVEDDRAGLPCADHPAATWTWVRRSGAMGEALAAHLRSLELDPATLYLWAAGERGLVKHVRSVVKHDLSLDRGRHFSQFYWYEGKPTG